MIAPTVDRQRRLQDLFDLIHHGLILLLVLWRPLASGMSPGAFDNASWNLLPGLGILVCLFESAVGLRERWRWTWTAVVAAGFLAAILPSCLAGPDPATACGDWLDLLALLALAVYLVQVLPGRERFCVATLAAGLTAQLCLATVQQFHLLPMLSDPVQLRQLLPEVDDHTFADIQERVNRGGIYTVFRIANGLAMYLVMIGLVLLGSVWQAGRRHPLASAITLAVLILTGAAYAFTGAKGAALAGSAALAWVLLARLPVWSRWLLRLAGLVAVIFLVLRPPASVAPSVQVREGYARAAWGLIAEAPWQGHGWNAFAAEGGRHLPLGTEFSKHVHHAWLEVAVSSGIPLALLLAGLMLLWLRFPLGSARPYDVVPEQPRRRHLLVLCAAPILLGYITCFGTMVSDNLAWWTTRGDELLTLILLGAVIGVPATLVAQAVYRLPRPPRWAGLAAVGAFCLGCLVDFHFAEPALLGMAVVAACLVTDSEQPVRLRRLSGITLCLLAVALMTVNVFILVRLLRRQEVEGHLVLLRVATTPTTTPARALACLDVLIRAYPGGDDRARIETLLRHSYAEAESFPYDTTLLFKTVVADYDLHRRFEHLQRCLQAGRVNGTVYAQAIEAARLTRHYGEAVEWSRRRVELHPAHLGFRYDHAELLRWLIHQTRDPERIDPLVQELERTLVFMQRYWDAAHFRVKRGIPATWNRPVAVPDDSGAATGKGQVVSPSR